MKRTFKAGLITVCMTALATAPIVTITTLATADAAYAKGGNGNNGGGGGNSSAGGKGHGQDKAASARSGGKDAKGKGKGKAYGQTRSASKGGPKTIGEFFQKLTGQDKKASRTTTSRGASASAKKTVPTEITEAPAKRGGKRIAGMHASQLGNMNAAYNANINAVLAHIRNGNTNGPVGVVAGLAVAKVAAEGQQDILDIESAYVTLDEAIMNSVFVDEADPLAAYEMSLMDARTAVEDPAVEAALDALANPPEGATQEDLDQALTEALEASPNLTTDDKSLEAYAQTLDEAETAARDSGIDDALAGLPTDRDTAETIERPMPDVVEAAAEAVEDLIIAEDAIIETWNKSDAANEEDTAALLDALHTRILDNEGAIKSTIAETTSDTEGGTMDGDGIDGDLADCEDGDLCGEGELEEIASAD